MVKIMFVCHGNICRSPMAEFLMKEAVKNNGMASEFYIASAATSREEIGNPVYPPVRRLLGELGISCKGKTAVQITKSDYDRYDYIIGMDSMNMRNMMRIFGSDPEGKLSLLLDFTNHPRSVSDPWYSGDFQTAYNDIKEGCDALLGYITNNDLK